MNGIWIKIGIPLPLPVVSLIVNQRELAAEGFRFSEDPTEIEEAALDYIGRFRPIDGMTIIGMGSTAGMRISFTVMHHSFPKSQPWEYIEFLLKPCFVCGANMRPSDVQFVTSYGHLVCSEACQCAPKVVMR